MGAAFMAREHGTTATTRNHPHGHNAESHEKYYRKPIPESGTEIKYDVEQLRATPTKLQNWLQERQTSMGPIRPTNETLTHTASEIWTNIHDAIKHGLQSNYPIRINAQNNETDINYEHYQWGTATGRHIVEEKTAKCKKLQKQIANQDKQIMNNKNHVMLLKIIQTWAQRAQETHGQDRIIRIGQITNPRHTSATGKTSNIKDDHPWATKRNNKTMA